MPGSHPTDAELRAADRIILVDPNRPGWYQPLHTNFQMSGQRTVEVLIDSADVAAVREARDRVRALKLDE